MYSPDRHPLEIGSHSIHLPLVYANTTVLTKRIFGVVQSAGSIPVPVIRDLYTDSQIAPIIYLYLTHPLTVVVPGRYPGKVLGGKLKIRIRTILFIMSISEPNSIARSNTYLSVASPIVMQTKQILGRRMGSLALCVTLIYVIT